MSCCCYGRLSRLSCRRRHSRRGGYVRTQAERKRTEARVFVAKSEPLAAGRPEESQVCFSVAGIIALYCLICRCPELKRHFDISFHGFDRASHRCCAGFDAEANVVSSSLTSERIQSTSYGEPIRCSYCHSHTLTHTFNSILFASTRGVAVRWRLSSNGLSCFSTEN